MKRAH